MRYTKTHFRLGGGFVTPLKPLVLVLAFLACERLQAGPCVSGGTLFSYEGLGATGCTVGTLTAFNFGFSVLGSSGGAVPVTDLLIHVTPSFDGNGLLGGLNFASAGFNVSVNQSIQYLITYTWDPHDDIESMDDIMDPPSANLGFARVTTVGCIGAAFTGPVCPTLNTSTVTVFDNNGVTQFNNSAMLSPATQILGIRTTIDLQALGGSASFDSLSGEARVPEPATWGLCGAALTLLLAARLRGIRSRRRA
jgi:hypothetical protein